MNAESDETSRRLAGDVVVIQRNPASGSGRSRRKLHELVRELRNRSWRLRMFHSRTQLDSFVQQEQDAASIHCLVAAGGDGTVSSLVNRHPHIPVAVLPMGTENLIARHLKMPSSGTAVARTIDAGHYREFDTVQILGHQTMDQDATANQRFLIMASAGIDAEIVHRLHAGRTGHIRHWSYIRPILSSLLKYDRPLIRVTDTVANRTFTGHQVIVSNFREYGLNARFNPDADPTDNQLDVCVFQGTTLVQTLSWLLCSLFRTQTGRHIVRFRSNHVRLTATEDPASHTDTGPGAAAIRIPLQADGDPAGHLPAEFKVNASTMRLLIPPPPARPTDRDPETT